MAKPKTFINQKGAYHSKGFFHGRRDLEQEINPHWTPEMRQWYVAGYRIGKRELERHGELVEDE